MIMPDPLRTVRVAADILPLFWEPCAFETPPCPRCEKHSTCGGFEYQFMRYAFAPALNATVEFIRGNGWDLSEGPGSVLSKVESGMADISSPYMTLTLERKNRLASTFPLWFTRYTAIVEAPIPERPQLTLQGTLGSQGVNVLLTILFTYLICTVVDKYARYLPQGSIVWAISSVYRKFPYISFWITICVLLSYLSSVVTIAFYTEQPVTPPFRTFSELAEGMKDGQFRVLLTYEVTKQLLFEQKGVSKILDLLYDAGQKSRPIITTIADAMDRIFRDKRHVLILIDEGDLRVVRQQYCNFLEIPDENELQMEMHGFYYGNDLAPRLGWYQRNVLMEQYRIYSTWYTWNSTHNCKDTAFPSTQGISITQLRQVFYMFLAFCGVALVAMAIEVILARLWSREKPLITVPTITNLMRKKAVNDPPPEVQVQAVSAGTLSPATIAPQLRGIYAQELANQQASPTADQHSMGHINTNKI